MSASPLKADIARHDGNVRFVPELDAISPYSSSARAREAYFEMLFADWSQ